jgi:hypothetical protein
MHLFHDPDDPRLRQRERIRRELARLIATLERDCPSHLVLNGLVAVARELHLRLEGGDGSGGGRP